jgi:hypothetical protein
MRKPTVWSTTDHGDMEGMYLIVNTHKAEMITYYTLLFWNTYWFLFGNGVFSFYRQTSGYKIKHVTQMVYWR